MKVKFINQRILIISLSICLGASNLPAKNSGTKLNTPVLTGTVTAHEAQINLNKEDSLDWFFCAFSGSGATYHKDTVNILSGYQLLNVDRYDWFSNALSTFFWTNGKPVKSGSKTEGHYISGLVGRGLTMSVPADTIMRVLKIYLGAYEAKGKITAQFEGTTAPIYTSNVTASQGGVPVEKLCTIQFKADSVGRKLLVKYEIERGYYQNFGSTDPKAITGNVSLNAVCLAKDFATTAEIIENTNSDTFSIYPNPVSGINPIHVSFNLESSSDVSLKIINIVGAVVQKVNNQKMKEGMHTIQIDNWRMLNAGVYFIQFSANGKCISQKVIKTN